ncbi:hypothetical protein [Streptomyces sp. KO7888]|nr:hypothetical protein [Streptomyces sp. KO7888]
MRATDFRYLFSEGFLTTRTDLMMVSGRELRNETGEYSVQLREIRD